MELLSSHRMPPGRTQLKFPIFSQPPGQGLRVCALLVLAGVLQRGRQEDAQEDTPKAAQATVVVWRGGRPGWVRASRSGSGARRAGRQRQAGPGSERVTPRGGARARFPATNESPGRRPSSPASSPPLPDARPAPRQSRGPSRRGPRWRGGRRAGGVPRRGRGLRGGRGERRSRSPPSPLRGAVHPPRRRAAGRQRLSPSPAARVPESRALRAPPRVFRRAIRGARGRPPGDPEARPTAAVPAAS